MARSPRPVGHFQKVWAFLIRTRRELSIALCFESIRVDPGVGWSPGTASVNPTNSWSKIYPKVGLHLGNSLPGSQECHFRRFHKRRDGNEKVTRGILKKPNSFEKIWNFRKNLHFFVEFRRFSSHPWTFIDPTRPRDRLDSTQNIAQSTALAEYVLKMPNLFENYPLVVENELSKVKTTLNV